MDSIDVCFIITALCIKDDYMTISGKVPCLLSSPFVMMLAMLIVAPGAG